MKRISLAVAKKRLHKVHPDYKLLKFTSMSKKATFECSKGHIWTTIAYHIIGEHRTCPKCNDIRISKKRHMMFTKKFDRDLAKASHGTIKRVGEFVNRSTKIAFKCSKSKYHHGVADPTNLLRNGCPFCSGNRHTSHWLELQAKKCGIKPLQAPRTMNSVIKVECKRGHIWKATVDGIMFQNNRCPICRNIAKSHKFSWLKKLADKRGYKILKHTDGHYARLQSYVLVECPQGHKWFTKVANFVRYDCPKCYHNYKGETATSKYLKGKGFKELAKDKEVLNQINTFGHSFKIHEAGHRLSYDFILNFHGSIYTIEFDGAQHDHPISYFGGDHKYHIQQYHDHLKNEWSLEHLHHHVIRINNCHDLKGKYLKRLVRTTLDKTLKHLKKSLLVKTTA